MVSILSYCNDLTDYNPLATKSVVIGITKKDILIFCKSLSE